MLSPRLRQLESTMGSVVRGKNVGTVISHKLKPMQLEGLPSVLKLGCGCCSPQFSPCSRLPARRPVWSMAVAPWPWTVGGACSWGPPKKSGEGRGKVCVYSPETGCIQSKATKPPLLPVDSWDCSFLCPFMQMGEKGPHCF